MPIPDLVSDYLPPGIYDCTIDELRERFATNEQRVRLFEGLMEYIEKIENTGLDCQLFVDRSFTTSKDFPDDMDIVLITDTDTFISLNEFPNSKLIIREYTWEDYGLHVFPGIEDLPETEELIEFFTHERGKPDVEKGLLRLRR